MSQVLEKIKSNEPGRYLTEEEYQQFLAESPHATNLVAAAKHAEQKEAEVVQRCIKAVLKKYEFRKVYEYGEEKCIRDAKAVYRYAVFAMLCNDIEMLRNKLLYWMRLIIQSFGFPGGNKSIEMTYQRLNSEAKRAMDPSHYELLEPYLTECANILPAEEVG